ncbi:MAG TPA: thiamine-phosphate kinase [Acidobacteriaceae bacterium]|nr:thiamine-phosphate kinase [Acidobacteriaceae bacterium]
MKTTEGELIRAIRERVTRQRAHGDRIVRLGIGDDCAILRPPRGRELTVTTDLTLENVHFRRDWHPAQSVGHRCLVRGLSDLAAMGARPDAAFLSLSIPRELAGRWLNGFLDGWMLAAKRYGVVLAGGDTAEAPRAAKAGRALFAADVILIGSAPAGKALRRGGASAGDLVYVTGELGGAAAELRSLARNPAVDRKRDLKRHPHLYPEPRLQAGARLMARALATAAIDLSDGLSTDLAHLCQASGLRAEIDVSALPLAQGAALDDALHGGEDYELLFTARPGTRIPATIGGIPVHAIGRMRNRSREKNRPPVDLCTREGARVPLPPGGWEHFRGRA